MSSLRDGRIPCWKHVVVPNCGVSSDPNLSWAEVHWGKSGRGGCSMGVQFRSVIRLHFIIKSSCKYGTEYIIAPFTGDNPIAIVALSASGDAILSLGTLTTLLLSGPPPPFTATSPTLPKCTTTSHLLHRDAVLQERSAGKGACACSLVCVEAY